MSNPSNKPTVQQLPKTPSSNISKLEMTELPKKSSSFKIIIGIVLGVIAFCSLSLLYGILGSCEKKCDRCLRSKTERVGFMFGMICACVAIGLAVIFGFFM